jgi:hypothetical protein
MTDSVGTSWRFLLLALLRPSVTSAIAPLLADKRTSDLVDAINSVEELLNRKRP